MTRRPAIGIMQGRLTAATTPGQAFPWNTWRDEFDAAAAIGFDAIEWLITDAGLADNPIWSAGGRHDIKRLVARTGVGVRSICADCFITRRLDDRSEQRAHVGLLIDMIVAAADARIAVIVIPLLEHSAVAPSDVPQLVEAMRPAIDAALARGVVLAIEADTATTAAVLAAAGPSAGIGACYDTGNAAAIGANATADLSRIGPALAAVHIKDRLPQGASVPLGQGAADFADVFDALARTTVVPLLVCETPRGDDPAARAGQHLDFVRTQFAAATAALVAP